MMLLLDYYRKVNAKMADSMSWFIFKSIFLGLAGLASVIWVDAAWEVLDFGNIPMFLTVAGLQVCVLTTIFRAGEAVDVAHNIWKARR